MTIEELDHDFADRFLWHRSLRLLRPQDALSYVAQGYAKGLILQGMDGFHLREEGRIQPDMRLDRNISCYRDLDHFMRESTDVIRAAREDPSIVFEVTLTDISNSHLKPQSPPSQGLADAG